MKEKIVGTLSAGMSSVKKGIQSGVDSCKLEGKISEQHHLIKKLKKEICKNELLWKMWLSFKK